MKKTLLLSVVAASAVMAGGNISPVVAQASGWDFAGNAVVYYQTGGSSATTSLFTEEDSSADAGLTLRATNSNVFNGIGMGFAVNGLATLGLENSIVDGVMLTDGGNLTGGYVSEAYVTTNVANTDIKAGRQTLPQSLSPLAYSDSWNVFANTFDAVVAVNSSLFANTTLVGAWVYAANSNAQTASISTFSNLQAQDGVWMLTAQNKSIENVTLTGSYYYSKDHINSGTDDLQVIWADAQTNVNGYDVAAQYIDMGDLNINAWGVKVAGAVNGINVMAAYTNQEAPNTANTGVFAVGTTTSSLYTNTVLNQLHAKDFESADTTKYVVSANTDVLGGNVTAAYSSADSDRTGTVNELDLVYARKVADINLVAAYVNVNDALDADVVRVVASYNF